MNISLIAQLNRISLRLISKPTAILTLAVCTIALPFAASSQEYEEYLELEADPVMIDPIPLPEINLDPIMVDVLEPAPQIEVQLSPETFQQIISPSMVNINYSNSVSGSGSSSIHFSGSAYIGNASASEYSVKSMSAVLRSPVLVDARAYVSLQHSAIVDVYLEVLDSSGEMVSRILLNDQSFQSGSAKFISAQIPLPFGLRGSHSVRISIMSADGSQVLFIDSPRACFSL